MSCVRRKSVCNKCIHSRTAYKAKGTNMKPMSQFGKAYIDSEIHDRAYTLESEGWLVGMRTRELDLRVTDLQRAIPFS